MSTSAPTGSRNASTISRNGQLSLSEVVDTLVRHGCLDVTPDLDVARVSERAICEGGFGDIYSGYMKSGVKVALKCPRLGITDDESRRRLTLFAREIHTWSKCEHKHILALLGLTTHNGRLAVVSPWMENGALPEYITKKPDVDRLELCLQIARGLVYLHDHDTVHGDLKGYNVLVSTDGVIKLSDFGNTKLKEQSVRVTTRTSPVSSLRWAAPEILAGSPHSKQADVYALGMTMLETVTGDVPYSDRSDTAVVADVLIHRRFPTRDDDSIQIRGSKDWLWDCMERCWSHPISDRPQAAEVEAEIASVLGEEPIPPPATIDITSDTPLPVVVRYLVARANIADLTDELLSDSTNVSSYPIASGVYDDTYRATRSDGTQLAIKCLRQRDPKHLERTALELITWSKLKHPYVLELSGLALFRDFLAMISPWMELGPVTSALKRSPGMDRFRLCRQVAQAVEYIHDMNVVHGDIKGSSILVGPSGIPKLAGFGLSIRHDRVFRFSPTDLGGGAARWMARGTHPTSSMMLTFARHRRQNCGRGPKDVARLTCMR